MKNIPTTPYRTTRVRSRKRDSQRQTAQQTTKVSCSEAASLSRAARRSTASGTTQSQFQSKLWSTSVLPPSPTETDIKCRNGSAAEHSRSLTLTAALQLDSRALPPRSSPMKGTMFGFSMNNNSGERVRRANLVRLLQKSMVQRTVSDPSSRTVPQSGHTIFTASDPGVVEPTQAGQVGRTMGMVLPIGARVKDCTRTSKPRKQDATAEEPHPRHISET